jgi:hypothetical protein
LLRFAVVIGVILLQRQAQDVRAAGLRIVDANFWDEVERSQRMSGAQRMSSSLRLFDEAARRMLAGIKHQFPGVSEGEACRIRNELLNRIRRLESLP